MSDKKTWPTTQGLVYSVEWFDGSRQDEPHYAVTYSYRVDGEYVGTFNDYISQSDDYLHRDDTITIAYDPAKPEHSFTPMRPSRVLVALSCMESARLSALSSC